MGAGVSEKIILRLETEIEEGILCCGPSRVWQTRQACRAQNPAAVKEETHKMTAAVKQREVLSFIDSSSLYKSLVRISLL